MTKLLDADIYKPVKEWQSLSKKEVNEIVSYPWGKTEDWVRAIEEALKEKNNG